MKLERRALFIALFSILASCGAQGRGNDNQPLIRLQRIAVQVRQVASLYRYLGQPFSQPDEDEINRAIANPNPSRAAELIETVLDKHSLVVLKISTEMVATVTRGVAKPDLVQNGIQLFLVKIVNEAGTEARLRVESPNSGPVYGSTFDSSPRPLPPTLNSRAISDRWMDVSLCVEGPLAPRLPNDLGIQADPQLSGAALEYRILLVYSRDAGMRSGTLNFSVHSTTSDASSASGIPVDFNVSPTPDIKLHVIDDDGRPTMASFIFQDSLGRSYPNPSKRLAPDFYFEPQVYRADGESISLAPGSYTAIFTGGPEYITETQNFVVDTSGPNELTFRLKRWINPRVHGWYSGDHHIHENGGAYYMDPTQGVLPRDMARQILGEHLNVASILNWGPAYYFQRQFFSGRQDNALSRPDALLHYDLEVSGFPSSHAGHLVLLNLADQDYPDTKQIEDWPSWDLPILRWAKAQGATAGFAHSGGGFALGSTRLPNYEVPPFDAPGALESIVDVTYPNTVDFLGVGNGPFPDDLNAWYQMLNVGFRPRIAGETDLCCIYLTRVGMSRTYGKIKDGTLTYARWLEIIREGGSYVSDGRSHLMDFAVNGTEVGTRGSEVNLSGPAKVQIEANVTAYLEPAAVEKIRSAAFDEQPYWSTERARIGETREVPVEVIVNGKPVARQEIKADGSAQRLKFEVSISQSSWVALRIVPAAHTNPIFVLVKGKPIRTSRRSAEWLLEAVDQCWSQNASVVSTQELADARKAYEHARQTYQTLINESNLQ